MLTSSTIPRFRATWLEETVELAHTIIRRIIPTYLAQWRLSPPREVGGGDTADGIGEYIFDEPTTLRSPS